MKYYPLIMSDEQVMVSVFKSNYLDNDRVAIELMLEDGEPWAVATVNMPEIPLAEDEVIIKTYSENEGVLECLLAANVVSKPLRYVPAGYTQVPIVKLHPETEWK